LVRPGGLSPLGRVVLCQAGPGRYVAFRSGFGDGELRAYNEVDGAAVDGPNWASVRREFLKVSTIETIIAVPANVLVVDGSTETFTACTSAQLQIGGTEGDDPKIVLQMDTRSAKGGNLGMAVAYAVTDFLKQQPRRSVSNDLGTTDLMLQLNLPVAAFRLQAHHCASQAKTSFIKQVTVGIRVEAWIEVSEARLRPSIWPVAETVSATCGHLAIENTASFIGKPIDRVVSQLEGRACQLRRRPASWQTLFIEVENDPEKWTYVLDFDPALAGSISSKVGSREGKCSSRQSSQIGIEGDALPLPILLGSRTLENQNAENQNAWFKSKESQLASEDYSSQSQEPQEEPSACENDERDAVAQASLHGCSCAPQWLSGVPAHRGWISSWWCPSEMQSFVHWGQPSIREISV